MKELVALACLLSPVVVVPGDEPGTPFCFGVGCPCGNDDPNAGCMNGTGQGALLTGSGSASISSDDLTFHGEVSGLQGVYNTHRLHATPMNPSVVYAVVELDWQGPDSRWHVGPRRKLGDLRQVAMAMRRGGVGYYPKAGFVHLDVGRVRSW